MSEGNRNKRQRIVNPKFPEPNPKVYVFNFDFDAVEAVREGNCGKTTW